MMDRSKNIKHAKKQICHPHISLTHLGDILSAGETCCVLLCCGIVENPISRVCLSHVRGVCDHVKGGEAMATDLVTEDVFEDVSICNESLQIYLMAFVGAVDAHVVF